MRRMLILALVVSFLVFPGQMLAQSLTGSLVGSVVDAQGGTVMGATVNVASPALIGGVRTFDTDAKGRTWFATLPPGVYTLDVSAPGFAPYHETGIRIGAGATIQRRIVLTLAGVTQAVDVPALVSHLDPRATGVETRFSSDEMQRIPVRRFSMFDFIRAAPGVSPTSPTSGSTNSVSAFGSGANENIFLIDGTNFTCPCSGEARAEPGFDFISEIQVQSAGASVEHGNFQGAVVNVITRQGGDTFRHETAYYFQAAGLTSQPVTLPVTGSNQSTGYERERYRDFNTQLGGPIATNRVWFFGAYQHLRDYDSQPGTDPSFPRTYEQDKLFGKLTWRFTPALQLVQSYHQEWWVNPELPTPVKPFEATQRRHASVPAMTFGHLTHSVGRNTVWDLRVGRYTFDRDDDPSSGLTTVPGHIDRLTGVASGAPQTFGGINLIRTTAKGAIDHYRPNLWGTDHQWKVGAQLERGEHRLTSIIPTGVRYVDNAGQPFQSISSDPSINGGLAVTASGFISDVITVGAATISAGLRFDHSRASSPDVHAIDADGNETSDVIQGLGTLYTWHTWSPRLGVTVRLTRDSRTVLRASYGRFHQGVLTGELSPFHPGQAPVTTRTWDATTGAYTSPVVVIPGTNLRFDSNTRPPHTDEYSIGLDRELLPQLSIAAAYVYKRGSDFIGWRDVGGEYREESRPLPDGRQLPVWVLTNGAASRRFLLTNQDSYGMRYDGLVLAAEKRKSNGWQLFGSYTFSRASGLLVSSGTSAAGVQVSTIAGAPFLTFGQDPNSLTNARGRLANDRPHMLRVMGSIDLPRTGILLAANIQQFSGKPWAATTQLSLSSAQADQRILIEPPGSRRLPSQTMLDVRVSKPFTVSGVRIELLLDVLNVLDASDAEALASDNFSSPTFGSPTVFVDPRRAMIGVRLGLGH